MKTIRALNVITCEVEDVPENVYRMFRNELYIAYTL